MDKGGKMERWEDGLCAGFSGLWRIVLDWADCGGYCSFWRIVLDCARLGGLWRIVLDLADCGE